MASAPVLGGSKTVDLDDPRKSIERGLRAVWASTWKPWASSPGCPWRRQYSRS